MSAPVEHRVTDSVHLNCITIMSRSLQGVDMGSGLDSAST